jgi:2-keto-4-pentenoate hydratase/2-oxohepta-3-ene-1,7-dioic acid hydratase in catechol pathway
MKLCRYDDDRLGLVRGDLVHDVTPAQTEIRAAAPYAMQGDAVIAALPAWRSRLEQMAAKTPGRPVAGVKLLSPVARPSKLVAAPTNYKAHIEEMAARAATANIKPSPAIGTAGLFLKANSSLVGPSEGVAIRFPERRNEHEVELAIIFGKQGSDIARADALDYVAGYCIGLDMTARGPEDRSFRKSIDGYSVLGASRGHYARPGANVVSRKVLPKEIAGARIAQYRDPDGLEFSVGEERALAN